MATSSRSTSYLIRDDRGTPIAVHHRLDVPGRPKRFWWAGLDGSKGLPAGVDVIDLPLFGSELVRTIPITKFIVIVEGEKAALALRQAGVPALATVCGAATTPTVAAVVRIAFAAKFILLPDHDPAGLKHMKDLAQVLYAAGAREVRLIEYRPDNPEHDWPKGTDAADFATAALPFVLGWLLDDWSTKVRRASKHETTKPSTKRAQRDKGSVTEALRETFGMDVRPGRSVRCPMHPDRSPSLSVLRDDRRAICHASCVWSSPGVTAKQIRTRVEAAR